MLPYLPLPSKAEQLQTLPSTAQQFGWRGSRGAGIVAAFTRKKVIGASAPVASKMGKGGKTELIHVASHIK